MAIARWNCRLGRLASLACLLGSFSAPAQVVNDGATNTLNGGTTTFAGDVTVGTNGSFTLLILTNNALLTNSGNGVIGRNAGANSNTVRLTGANTRWLMSLDLFVGSNGSFNRLVVSNGALVGNNIGALGIGPTSSNNEAAVTGTNSFWSNRSVLYVGFVGSGNRLVVSNGGRVADSSGFLGGDGTSSNNEAAVTGPGSLWSNRTNLYVGFVGSGNRLVVSNGGTVLASNGVFVGFDTSSSNNRVVVDGGTLRAANTAGTSVFDLQRGTNVLNAGLIDVDRLVMTNTRGRFDFRAGTLVTRGTFISNGTSFSVGATGGGATWDVRAGVSNQFVDGPINVGDFSGNNSLVITNGALLTNDGSGTLGVKDGDSGNVAFIGGAGSRWLMSGSLRLGGTGSGNTLIVSNGGFVANGDGFVGTGGDNNLAVVTGASMWSNRLDLVVGDGGVGNQLMVSNGATVFASNDLVIGLTGTSSNNLLSVSAGALVTNRSDAVIGFDADAIFNTASLNGTNTRWLVGGEFIVGSNGAFNRLLVSNGATLLSSSGTIGSGSGSGNRAVVTGSGSAWSLGVLTVGKSNASGGMLVVSNGGLVRLTGGTAVVGADVGAPNNTIIVDGPGSLLTNGLGLLLGSQSASNTLVVTNGGQVVVSGGPGAGLTVGNGSAARANQVILSGTGSLLIERKVTAIGGSGADNQFHTSLGAAFSSPSVTIGSAVTASNNSAIITNSNSTWTVTSTVTVGDNGANNLLSISAGARVTNGGDGILGGKSNANFNTAIIAGTNSRWLLSGDLFIGSNGAFNRLVISNGGLVVADHGFFGPTASSSNNEAVVTGAGSLWSNRLSIFVGDNGAGNRLVIDNGATVLDTSCTIGNAPTSDGNAVIVTGARSLWSNQSSVALGQTGSSNLLVISNAGTVFASNLIYLGFTTNSTNNRVVVDGGTLRVANATGTGLFEVRRGTSVLNAGLIDVDQLVMTNTLGVFEFNGGTLVTRGAAISNGAPLFVVGTTGTNPAIWDVRAGTNARAGTLLLGSNSPFNQLLVTNGALLANGGNGDIGLTSAANSNTVVLAGPGSRWFLGTDLHLGSNGSFNRMVVSNGAVLRDEIGVIGQGLLGSNNEVVVTGTGSVWSNSFLLVIGASGSRSRLIVSNGGSVFSSSLNLGATTNSTNNRISVESGTLRVTNAASTGALNVIRGTNVLNAGLIEVDRLLVTNAFGVFEFKGGTLMTENTTNNNGQVFTVGNGATAATFQLLGGTHAFSNNLVIASNATLSGNGTILGSVTNRGTISPGASAGSLRISGSLSLAASAGMSLEIGGLIPTNEYDVVTVTNLVEFAGTLSLSLINSFLPDDGDTFTLVSFGSSSGSFTNAPGGGRVSLTNNLASFAVTYTTTNFVLGNVQYVDGDGDGQGDLQEQAAGTDPANSFSLLTITSITEGVLGSKVIQFQSVSGKAYSAEYSNDLITWRPAVGAVFTSAGFDLHGNQLMQWIDDGTLTGGLPGAKRFYRIGLQ